MKRIYLDYASLTPIDKGVLKQINKFSKREYSNPSALYASAVKSKSVIEDAKQRIAKVLHSHPDEIIFTSGGTESNHLVLNHFKGQKIIVSSIEHSSIINADKNSFDITYVSVDKNGQVDLDLLKKSITSETALVSIMMVNNEIGTIQPIQEIAKIVRDYKKNSNSQLPLLHTDASQAPIHLPIYVEKLGVDMITLDGNKIYGPRGVGMLYVKRGSVDIVRAGTENIPGIMGFTYALEIAEKMREKESGRIAELKEFFIDELKKINTEIKVNGSNTTPHILNISIPNIDSEFFVLQLDAKGIECSTKSACLRDEDESYVLKAIEVSSKDSVRFSFGRYTTKGELKKVLGVVKGILEKNTQK